MLSLGDIHCIDNWLGELHANLKCTLPLVAVYWVMLGPNKLHFGCRYRNTIIPIYYYYKLETLSANFLEAD